MARRKVADRQERTNGETVGGRPENERKGERQLLSGGFRRAYGSSRERERERERGGRGREE
jgi:hypothetical protein